MSLGKGVGLFTGLASAVGILFAFDARYLHADAGEQIEQRAEQSIKTLKIDIERVRLANELSTQRARLSFLANKAKLSTDEKLEMDFSRSQVVLLQTQLAALQK